MKALTFVEPGRFELIDKLKPEIVDPKDAIVRITLSSICSSDLHIMHGAVPQAETGITVGHEMVGIVESVGSEVKNIKRGDRVCVNVETFCGECFYCKRGFVNNCMSGGWKLGCRIDGGQAELVRVPYADNGLTAIPENVSDEQALFVGDILATGYWAAKISEISEEDTVLIIGAGPTGLCTLECVRLYNPHSIVICEADVNRREFVKKHYPEVYIVEPCECSGVLDELTDGRRADRVIEVAGGEDTFELAWRCARPNAIVTIVALYEKEQVLPLPWMYGKNLTFKTGGVDACDCDRIMQLISEGRIDTTHLITHRFPLNRIMDAYRLFENREENVIKTAIYPSPSLNTSDEIVQPLNSSIRKMIFDEKQVSREFLAISGWETKRLLLRQWREDDAGALYKYASDGRVSELALWPKHTSIDMSRQVIRDFFRPNPYTFAMLLKETDEPVGCIGLVPRGEEHYKTFDNEREVGYWIGYPLWGKGLTTEALSAFIDFCRNSLRLGSLLITTDAGNIASQRVAEKCGFSFIAAYTFDEIDSRAYRLAL